VGDPGFRRSSIKGTSAKPILGGAKNGEARKGPQTKKDSKQDIIEIDVGGLESARAHIPAACATCPPMRL
jgi:hypothetical protein